MDSPLYVSLDRGASSLGSGSVDAFVYIPGENFTFEHYTSAYFTGEGLAGLDTYGDEYEDRVLVLGQPVLVLGQPLVIRRPGVVQLGLALPQLGQGVVQLPPGPGAGAGPV